MEFDYKLDHIRTDALVLDYFKVPWDTEILQRPVAEISRLEIREPVAAREAFLDFTRWCEGEAVFLCHCRLGQDKVTESMFLEAHGFRFIEMNYRPYRQGIQNMALDADNEIRVEQASSEDSGELSAIAATIFQTGRLHRDPRVGPDLGNLRYKTWLLNAFELPHQSVLKCLLNGRLVAFFVVEAKESDHSFWSLAGVVPDMQGKGIGKRAWRAMMHWHQSKGVDTVSTSISSYNTAVLNLYVSLGFRFPAPDASFHWCLADR